MRKVFLAAVAMSLVLSACGGESKPAATSESTTSLRSSRASGGSPREASLRVAADDCNVLGDYIVAVVRTFEDSAGYSVGDGTIVATLDRNGKQRVFKLNDFAPEGGRSSLEIVDDLKMPFAGSWKDRPVAIAAIRTVEDGAGITSDTVSRKLVALDLMSKRKLWQVDTSLGRPLQDPDNNERPPSYVPSVIVGDTVVGELYLDSKGSPLGKVDVVALSMSDGRELWKVPDASIRDGVYTRDDGSKVIRLGSRNGSIWVEGETGAPVDLAIADGVPTSPAGNGRLGLNGDSGWALADFGGRVLYSVSAPKFDGAQENRQAESGEGITVLAAPEFGLTAVDNNSGTVLWNRPEVDPVALGLSLMSVSNRYVTGTTRGGDEDFVLDAKTGKQLWVSSEHPVQPGEVDYTGGVLRPNGVLYSCEYEGGSYWARTREGVAERPALWYESELVAPKP